MSKRTWISAIAAIQLLTGCANLWTLRYFAPIPVDSNVRSTQWGDGVVFISGTMCIWVREGQSARARLLATGPIGLPIIPVGDQLDEESGYFELVLFFVSEIHGSNHQVRGENYSFDPIASIVLFDSGENVKPSTVQVSRFKTKWEKERVYLFHADNVETILYPEHWGPKPAKDFTEPLSLWDWSRFILRFERPSRNAKPLSLMISGLRKEGTQQPVTEIRFNETETTRYIGSYPTAYRSSPELVCRPLFKNEAPQRP